jgi:hypothetical protein
VVGESEAAGGRDDVNTDLRVVPEVAAIPTRELLDELTRRSAVALVALRPGPETDEHYHLGGRATAEMLGVAEMLRDRVRRYVLERSDGA